MTIPDHFADSREAVLKARELLRRAHAVIFDFDVKRRRKRSMICV